MNLRKRSRKLKLSKASDADDESSHEINIVPLQTSLKPCTRCLENGLTTMVKMNPYSGLAMCPPCTLRWYDGALAEGYMPPSSWKVSEEGEELPKTIHRGGKELLMEDEESSSFDAEYKYKVLEKGTN